MRVQIWRGTAVVLATTVLLSTTAGTALGHFSGRDAVDGNEIRYEDYTQWNDALGTAIAGWENLPGGVSIAPDSSSTIADLEVRDYYSSDGRCGYYTQRTGAGLVNLNNRYFNG